MNFFSVTLKPLQRFGSLMAVLALACTTALPVLALSEDQLISKLNTIPAFTIVDEKGNPVLLIPKEQQETTLLNFYLDPSLANQVMKLAKERKDEQAKNYRIVPTGLGQAYKVARAERQKKDSKVKFQFLTSPKSIKFASDIIKKKDPQAKPFQGVPIFFISGGEKKGILTLKREGQEYLPLFLSEDDLQRNLTELKKGRTNLPKPLAVEVATLDAIVSTILAGKNDVDSKKITFVPARTSLEYAQTLQKSKPK